LWGKRESKREKKVQIEIFINVLIIRGENQRFSGVENWVDISRTGDV
jgi:hypothetical protein